MLARTAPMPTGEGWAVEVKFDGVRLQLGHDGHALCLRSRPGRNCNEEFPELAAITGALGRHRVLLDGELVCLGADGSPDFASLRKRLRASADKARRHAERAPATFLAFRPAPPRRPLYARASLRAPAWSCCSIWRSTGQAGGRRATS
jgi:ATP-dependent DNA ligase